MRIAGLFFAIAVVVSACSKIPESESAKSIGAQPKQVLDKAATDVNKALQGGAQSRQDAASTQSESK
jgi:hypothetical protein